MSGLPDDKTDLVSSAHTTDGPDKAGHHRKKTSNVAPLAKSSLLCFFADGTKHPNIDPGRFVSPGIFLGATEAAEKRDYSGLTKYGIDLQYAWANTVFRRGVDAESPIEFDIGTFNVASHIDEKGNYKFDATKLSQEELVCLKMGSLLRNATHTWKDTRFVAFVDDTSTPHLDAAERGDFNAQLCALLAENDAPGIKQEANINTIHASDQSSKAARKVLRKLYKNRNGSIIHRKGGDVVFLPSLKLIDQAGIHLDHRGHSNTDRLAEMKLYERGKPTSLLQELASYQERGSADTTRTTLRDSKATDRLNQRYTCLFAMGEAKPEDTHDIEFDSSKPHAEMSEAFAAYFYALSQRYHHLKNAFAAVAEKDPKHYNYENYGEASKFDIATIGFIKHAMETYGIPPESLAKVVVPGAGAALLWGMTAAQFVKADGKLHLSDLSPNNVQEIIDELDRPIEDVMWGEWVGILAEKFPNVELPPWEKLQSVAKDNVSVGDMLKIPENTADAVMSWYASCSYHPDIDMTMKAKRAQARAGKKGAPISDTNMGNSTEWPAGIGPDGKEVILPANNLKDGEPLEMALSLELDDVMSEDHTGDGVGLRPGHRAITTIGRIPRTERRLWTIAGTAKLWASDQLQRLTAPRSSNPTQRKAAKPTRH